MKTFEEAIMDALDQFMREEYVKKLKIYITARSISHESDKMVFLFNLINDICQIWKYVIHILLILSHHFQW